MQGLEKFHKLIKFYKPYKYDLDGEGTLERVKSRIEGFLKWDVHEEGSLKKYLLVKPN